MNTIARSQAKKWEFEYDFYNQLENKTPTQTTYMEKCKKLQLSWEDQVYE